MNSSLFLTPLFQTPKIYTQIDSFLSSKEKKRLKIISEQTFHHFSYLINACLIRKTLRPKNLFQYHQREKRVDDFLSDRCQNSPLIRARNLEILLDTLPPNSVKDVLILLLLKKKNEETRDCASDPSVANLMLMLRSSSREIAKEVFFDDIYIERDNFKPLFKKIFEKQEGLLPILWLEIIAIKIIEEQPYREPPIARFWYDLFKMIETSTCHRQNSMSMIYLIPRFITSLQLLENQILPARFSIHYFSAYKKLVTDLLCSAKKSFVLCDQRRMGSEEFSYFRDRICYLFTYIQEQTGGYRQVIEILGDIECRTVYKISSHFLIDLLWTLEEISWLAEAIKGTRQDHLEIHENMRFISERISQSSEQTESLLEKTYQIIEKTGQKDPILTNQFITTFKTYWNR